MTWTGMTPGRDIYIQLCDDVWVSDPVNFTSFDCNSASALKVAASQNASGSGSAAYTASIDIPNDNGAVCAADGTPTGVVNGPVIDYNPCLVRVMDTFLGNSASQLFLTLHIGASAALTADRPPPILGLDLPFSYTFAATGIPVPTFSVTSGSLPAGLNLDPASGVLSGTPTVTGTSLFTVAATNDVPSQAISPPISLTVMPPAPPAFISADPPVTVTVNVPYRYTFSAAGSPSPTFTVTGGVLPGGLSLDPDTGVLAGIPNVTGTFSFSVTASNGQGVPAVTPALSIDVSAFMVFTAADPSTTRAVVGTPFSYRFIASGQPPPTYSASGMIPPGLSLDPSGVLSGTPTTYGRFSFTVTAGNGFSNPVTTGLLTMDVLASPSFTASSPPGPATVDAYYAYTFAATGNPAPTFTVTAGSLPAGMSLDPASGLLSGYPQAAGTYPFTVAASNGVGAPASVAVTLQSIPANPALRLSASAVTFPALPVGSTSGPLDLGVTAIGGSTVTIDKVAVGGPNPGDFPVASDACSGVTLNPAQPSCGMQVVFAPSGGGPRQATLIFTTSAGVASVHLTGQGVGSAPESPEPVPLMPTAAQDLGYWLAASDGGVFAYGAAPFYGSTGSLRLNKPVVGIASSRRGAGYWLVASDGGVFAFGSALFHGSTGSLKLNQPIVAMAGTPDGTGYWLVAADGGVFSFGSAGFHGSTGSLQLAKPVVGMTPAPDGAGYWLAASDGGVFAFGSARFFGSAAGATSQPIAGIAAAPDGAGYWLVASGGTMYAKGSAAPLGPGRPDGPDGPDGLDGLAKPIVGMAASHDGAGCWLVGADGGVFAVGSTRFFGSSAGQHLNHPIVGVAGSA